MHGQTQCVFRLCTCAYLRTCAILRHVSKSRRNVTSQLQTMQNQVKAIACRNENTAIIFQYTESPKITARATEQNKQKNHLCWENDQLVVCTGTEPNSSRHLAKATLFRRKEKIKNETENDKGKTEKIVRCRVARKVTRNKLLNRSTRTGCCSHPWIRDWMHQVKSQLVKKGERNCFDHHLWKSKHHSSQFLYHFHCLSKLTHVINSLWV